MDSLASHMVSEDGIKDFKILKPAVDYRTADGKDGHLEHPHWNDEEKVVTYEIHEPRQDDLATGPPSPSGAILPSGRLRSRQRRAWLKQHERCALLQRYQHPIPLLRPHRFRPPGPGHHVRGRQVLPDHPDRNRLRHRRSPGRNGPGENGRRPGRDGKVDHWSNGKKPGRRTHRSDFAKQVDRTPAKVSFADLPAGKGFQIEVKLLSPEGHKSLPKLDQLIATFDSSQK